MIVIIMNTHSSTYAIGVSGPSPVSPGRIVLSISVKQMSKLCAMLQHMLSTALASLIAESQYMLSLVQI